MRIGLLTFAFFGLLCGSALGQFDDPVETIPGGVTYGPETTHRYQIGINVRAVGGPCSGLYGTIAVPSDWPEQQVRIVDEKFSPGVRRVAYRTLPEQVKQMQVEIPILPTNAQTEAIITLEIKTRTVQPPPDTTVFSAPRRSSVALMRYLGPSPHIDSTNLRIKSLAREITKEKETDWEKVEAIYDHVRENIEFREGDLKGASAALKDGVGCHEDLTSAFVALCRAQRIPARTVWVPDHSYAEFYLVDEDKRGHWFPCQVAGKDRAFGEMPVAYPILMKGDNFKIPETGEKVRFVGEFLKGKPVRGGGRPSVNFIRQPMEPE
jgi:hypothetical protein